MKYFLFFYFLFVSLTAIASTSARPCRDEFVKLNHFQIQMGSFDQQTCYLSLHSNAKPGLIYRDYILTSDGSLLVFNSFGDGSDSVDTGAREYFFFPRDRANFDFSLNSIEPALSVQFTNHDEILFSSENGEPVKMNKASIEVAPDVRRDNRGGVEIKNYQGILLDLGFTLGAAPSSQPKQKAEFRDQNGQRCQVVVKEVFKTTSDEPTFKYPTDQELKNYLSSRCPNLDLSSLAK